MARVITAAKKSVPPMGSAMWKDIPDERAADFVEAYRKLCKEYGLMIIGCDLCGDPTTAVKVVRRKRFKLTWSGHIEQLLEPQGYRIMAHIPGQAGKAGLVRWAPTWEETCKSCALRLAKVRKP